ncbi:MAG: YdeI/OmpD-associated family protein [Tepidiformaceae bacterium]
MDPLFFESPGALREWFETNHERASELYVGYYKKGTGRASPTWSESVDEALCFGWIDGRAKRIDDERWAIRFTPRRKGSTWSKVNIGKVAKLTELGLMRPAGAAAFAARTEAKSGVYSFEQDEDARLTPEEEAAFQADQEAWNYFMGQAPWYRRTALFLVVSAKRAETRERRLAKLMGASRAGEPIAELRRR